MSETAEVSVEPVVEPVVETSAEIEARVSGWKPESEFREQFGDEKPWKPAEQFNNDGKFMKKLDAQHYQIETQLSEIKGLNAKIDTVIETSKVAVKLEYQRALTDLKVQRTTAMNEGDVEKVNELNLQIEESIIENTKQEPSTPDPVPDPVPDSMQTSANKQIYNQWQIDNPWYGIDKDMTAKADELFNRAESDGELVFDKVGSPVNYSAIINRVARQVAVLKGNPQAPNMASPKGSAKTDVVVLNDEQEDALKQLTRTGMTREEVIKSWQDIGYL